MAPSKKKGESGKSIAKKTPPPPPPLPQRREEMDDESDDGEADGVRQGSSRAPEDMSILRISAGAEENDNFWREEMRNELRAELRSELSHEMKSARQWGNHPRLLSDHAKLMQMRF